jgi:hypothetical protein
MGTEITNKMVRFPEDLNSNRCIKFDFYAGKSFKAAINALEGMVTTTASALANLNSDSAGAILDAGGKIVSTAGSLLKQLGGEINNRVATKRYDTKRVKKPKNGWEATISLPVPNGLNETLNHDWNTDNGLVSSVLNMGIGPDSMAQKTVNGLAGLMGSRNVTVNPDYVQMYAGSQPREMSFSWTLMPNSEKDAKSIFAIVRRFKAYSSGIPTTTRAFLLAPLFCKVTIENPVLSESLKIDNMVIKNVSINYSEGSFMEMFHDGTPKAIVLSLSLMERTPKLGSDWLSDKYDEKKYYKLLE